MTATTLQIVSVILFTLAIVHTFCTGFFLRLAHRYPDHSGLWHLLGEVEVVFGFWAAILVLLMGILVSGNDAIGYLDSRNYTEPLFIFAIMVVAASRPVLQFAALLLRNVARMLPLPFSVANYAVIMLLVPLMGSLITEPAAMTLAALLLRRHYFNERMSSRFLYTTLGLLFVNISIGGTLTHFAAPPVLMVTSTWGWDTPYMFVHFGWKTALAVAINTALVTLFFYRELASLQISTKDTEAQNQVRTPPGMMLLCLGLLALILVFAHHPPVFLGILLLFLGLANAYPQFQDRLILREALLVAFFLAGLVVLGGQQVWWLQPLLTNMSSTSVYYGAMTLTAITDNAALTYLGSLVDELSEPFKYALVSGAVTGGGLTVIANAPNPAGLAILRDGFREGSVNLLYLFVAALLPTLVTILAFRLL